MRSYSRVKQEEGNFASICPNAIIALAKITLEGDERYGKLNWTELKKTPMEEFRFDTINHLMKHLELYRQGDRKEDHLAKIMWGCQALIHYDTECEHQKNIVE